MDVFTSMWGLLCTNKTPVLCTILSSVRPSWNETPSLTHQPFVSIFCHEYKDAQDERHQRRAEEPQPPEGHGGIVCVAHVVPHEETDEVTKPNAE